jgi:hypothetical protein
MRQLLRVSSLLLIAMFVATPTANAGCELGVCMCAGVGPSDSTYSDEVAHRFNYSAAVFVGTVRRLAQDSVVSYAELQVSRMWKGPHDSVIRIVIGRASVRRMFIDSTGREIHQIISVSSNCELSVRPESEWLIFATRDSTGALRSDRCSLSELRDKAGPTIAVLDGRRDGLPDVQP